MKLIFVTALLAGLAAFPRLASAEELTGVASVIDGDTDEIHGTRIRLHGIDAPESGQQCRDNADLTCRCGQTAALALADRVGRATATCRGSETDNYGRLIAVCFQGGEDLNRWMVEQGWAVAFRRYSADDVSSETAAKNSAIGIWSGSFVMPWDWRRGERLADRSEAEPRAGDCLLKGNINFGGDRIYHVAGGRSYAQTKITESKGERWFCSEAEARAAGWRRVGG